MGYPESFDELERWRDEQRLATSPEGLIRALENRIEHESDPVRLRILSFFLADEHVAQGNPHAAAAIRRKDPIEEIHRWHREWRQVNGDADILPVLEERLRTESHRMKASELRRLMIPEYWGKRDYAAIRAVLLDDYNTDPSEPMPLIALAGHKLYFEEQPEEAMRFANQAVDVALRAGVWRRRALGIRARSALRLGDYDAVEDAIKQLMELTFTRGNTDIGVERDFLDDLPPGSIDPVVARQYDEYCLARGVPEGGADSLDEPLACELPEREPPEWLARARMRHGAPAASDHDIDGLILSFAKSKSLKVARIVGDVLTECDRRDVIVNQLAVGDRIRVLVDEGKLVAFGNVSYWRHSEVKLPD